MEGAGDGHDAEERHGQANEARWKGKLVLFVVEYWYELV
jgi:hypothetical protein